ncbi:hypothetical protein ABC337_03565 [Arthrobacter sp. 1P04PC]|uniref:hypothetical protein n=1 Tax=unclassified Arthrobacter TaxID=235627 RepID=UPI00399F5B1D
MIDHAAILAPLTNHELLATPYALLSELNRRGIIRTSDLVGGVGEHLAWRMYGGVLALNGNKAYDLTDPGDRLIQVKTRVANRSEGQLKVTFKSLDGFDACLALLLAPETLQPVMAREVSRGDLEAMKARKSSLFIRDFRTAGIDVLDRASEAWAAVGRHG